MPVGGDAEGWLTDDKDRDIFGALPAGDDEGGAGGKLVGDVGEINGLAGVRRQ